MCGRGGGSASSDRLVASVASRKHEVQFTDSKWCRSGAAAVRSAHSGTHARSHPHPPTHPHARAHTHRHTHTRAQIVRISDPVPPIPSFLSFDIKPYSGPWLVLVAERQSRPSLLPVPPHPPQCVCGGGGHYCPGSGTATAGPPHTATTESLCSDERPRLLGCYRGLCSVAPT